MTMRHINIEDLQRYRQELIEAEKSLATTEKYIRDIKTFCTGWEMTKISPRTG